MGLRLMAECYVEGALVEEELCKLATQYRESTNFKAFIAVFLTEAELIQKALCDSVEIDIDRLGNIINFPRCWCNIKRKVVFGFEKPLIKYFGFTYEVGETEVVGEDCLEGLDDGHWQLPGMIDDCNLAHLQGCCIVNDPTNEGFCEGDFICDQFPSHIDHCFDDDVEYAMLLRAKLVADKAIGTIDDILDVAKIMYGDQTTAFFDHHGEVWLSINRTLTDNEIFLMDFYKNLLPAPVGVSITIIDGAFQQFGFTNSPCLTDRIGGFCDGVNMRRY